MAGYIFQVLSSMSFLVSASPCIIFIAKYSDRVAAFLAGRGDIFCRSKKASFCIQFDFVHHHIKKKA